MCRECWVLPSGVEFSTEENRPAKFQLEEFEVCTEDEARLWNEQIDELIANTSLLCHQTGPYCIRVCNHCFIIILLN